ncbi:MAG: choice-of-anchor J domain-containing protein [Clostridium sp.]|nr:choice-of-anchor J domain-containing protein [Clostridium sp.]
MNKTLTMAAVAALSFSAAMTASAEYPTRRGDLPQIRQQRPLTPFKAQSRPAAAPAVKTPAATTGPTAFAMHPTEAEFNACTVIDRNDDGYKIVYGVTTDMNGQTLDWPIYYNNNLKTESDADEWIITPAFEMTETENLWSVSIEARAGSNLVTPEAFEIFIGQSADPSQMTQMILDEPAISNLDFETFSSTFGIMTPGNYRVGIHIKSPRSAWRMMMRDLKISYTNMSANAPQPVTALTAVPDPEGLNFATVTFTLPTGTVNGKTIPANADVTATIVTPASTTTLTGHPGQTLSARVATVSGDNTIAVYATTADGQSAAARTTVRTSVDIPADPVLSKSVSADNMSVTITWDQVTTGKNNGIVIPDNILYNVYKYYYEESSDGMVAAGWLPVARDLSERSYTFTTTDQIQDIHDFIITSKNESGESDGAYINERLGQLLTMPVAEDFASMAIKYGGYVVDTPQEGSYDAQWGFVSASTLIEGLDNIGCMASISNSSSATNGRMAFPKFDSSKARDMVVDLTVYLCAATAPTKVYLAAPGRDLIEIGHIDPSSKNDWVNFQFAVPSEFDGADWLSIVLETQFPSYDYLLMLSSYEIHQLYQRDLSVENVAISDVMLDTTVDVAVRVRNRGVSDMTLQTPKAWITLGGTKIADIELTGAGATLARGEDALLNGQFELSKSELVGRSFELNVTLSQSDDEPANDSATVPFTLRASDSPVVLELMGERNLSGDGVVLEWLHPDEVPNIEGFEAYLHGEMGSKIGEWLNIDYDQKNVWTIDEVPMPDAVTPKAFQVINVAAVEGGNLDTHAGQQMLAVFSAQSALSDDWLISPEIDGSGGFSFWTNIISPEYPETLEVYASATDRELDSFDLVQTINQTQLGWTLRMIDLPAGTRYVALHYCSNDQFGMFIDDIMYVPAERKFEILGFNLYRNGSVIASRLTTTTYEDRDPGFETNVYNVSVIASRLGAAEREYALSEPFSLTSTSIESVGGENRGTVVASTGEILLSGFSAGDRVAVYATDGRLVRSTTLTGSETTALSLPAGLYMVDAAGETHALLVK